MTTWMKSRLSPFRHRDFRFFFLAQTLSLVGTMAADLARSWIILELLGRAGALGALNLAVAIPCLIFILWGGVVVDRTDVRKLMMTTKILLAASALALAVVVEMGHVEMWMLIVFAIFEGFISAFDAPAFQKIVVRLVPREDFQQAMAINSTNFHAARAMGPLLAGALMAWHGPGLVFIADGMTYVFVTIVLATITLKAPAQPVVATKITGYQAIKEGLQNIFGPGGMRYRMIQLYLSLMLIYPIVIVVFRAFVQKKFNLAAEEFGYVFMFPALGSLCGALSFAILKPSKPLKALKVAVPGAGLMVFVVTQVPELWMTTICMSLAGFFAYLSFASITVSMQLDVQEQFRGRLTALINMGFVAVGPLMTYPIGSAADMYGAQNTVMALAIGYLILSAFATRFYQPKASAS